MTISYFRSDGRDNTNQGKSKFTNLAIGSVEPQLKAAVSGTTIKSLDNDDLIAKIDFSQGQTVDIPSQHNSVNNRQKSLPSGYTAEGMPTFGDGASVVTTTWGTDNEVNSKGQFSFNRPAGVTNKDYDNLTS